MGRFNRPTKRYRFVTALLAIVCQLFLAELVPVMALASSASPLDNFAICYSGQVDDSGKSTPGPMPVDCSHCPICHALAQGVGFPAPPPVALVGREPAPLHLASLATKAPPVAATRRSAQPRAPPAI